MQEGAYKAWLETLPIVDGTIGNQLSRIHRLERAFGDLDQAFGTDHMAAILTALEYSAKDADAKKTLPPGISSRGGDTAGVMSTLRHAARKYRTFRIEQGVAPPAINLSDGLRPTRAPKTAPGRKLAPSGFWIFQANPSRWRADEWAASAETSLLYYVSKDDRELIQVGDLGVIRRTGFRGKPAAIVSLVEVVEATALRPELNPQYFAKPEVGAEPDYRVRLERLATFDPPLQTSSLPAEPEFERLRQGLQRTTTPFPMEAFDHLASLAGLEPLDLAAARGSRTQADFTALQHAASKAAPKVRHILSRRVERGPIGDKVKAARGHRCQICEALGREPVAFLKAGGDPYAEAHHVIFVSTLVAGVLDAANVMVLCPNHHRQAHYGSFEIVSADASSWTIRLDGVELVIPQTKIW